MMEVNNKTYSLISWDWKDCPDFDELCEALNPLGIYVIESPMHEESDTYGFIFSKEDLTSEELEEVSQAYYNE